MIAWSFLVLQVGDEQVLARLFLLDQVPRAHIVIHMLCNHIDVKRPNHLLLRCNAIREQERLQTYIYLCWLDF